MAALTFTDSPRRLRALARTITIFGFLLAMFGLTQSFTTDGTRVYFISLTGLIDHSVPGTINAGAGADEMARECVWVSWDDGTSELITIDNLIPLDQIRKA